MVLACLPRRPLARSQHLVAPGPRLIGRVDAVGGREAERDFGGLHIGVGVLAAWFNSPCARPAMPPEWRALPTHPAGDTDGPALIGVRTTRRNRIVGRSADKLSASLERVGHEDSVAHFVADATDEAATKDAVAATVEEFGGVDILFANAGTEGVAKPLETLTVEEFNHVLQTNVIGVWLSVKHCVAPVRERGGARS